MKHTPLFDVHMQTARNVINLKGFARPVEYVGHIAEHRAIRERVSLCDVSHMGELEFEGRDALFLVDKLITNDATRLSVNQALYSVMCDENGFILDDLVCFRLGEQRFLWVVNVTKTDQDFQWVIRHAKGLDVNVRNLSSDLALLALQGPYSSEVLQRVSAVDLSQMQYYWLDQTVITTSCMEVPCIVSRTGYTGERGYEICASRELVSLVWEELLTAGQPLGIVPHGVAARESARTEAGYLLNGNDIDGTTSPFEVGLDWVVRLNKHSDFVGKKALARTPQAGVSKKLVGLAVDGHTTIRHGYPIYCNGARIGRVTSGPLSPALVDGDASFGLGFVAAGYDTLGGKIEIDVRGEQCVARVVELPLSRRRVKEGPKVETLSPYELEFVSPEIWIKREDERTCTVGITEFFQREAGELLSVRLPRVGEHILKNGRLGWGDAYRRTFDVVAPVSGEVVAVNSAVLESPDDINKYPYSRAGLVTIKMGSVSEYDGFSSFREHMAEVRRSRSYESWSRELRLT